MAPDKLFFAGFSGAGVTAILGFSIKSGVFLFANWTFLFHTDTLSNNICVHNYKLRGN